MATGSDTLWDKFLKPVVGMLIDEAALRQLRDSIDWELEGDLATPRDRDRLKNPTLIYPDYYKTQNFHGINGGYLTVDAAVTYDPITQYVLPPNETWIRQSLIETIMGRPRRILDLGCGTGSTTLMLKQAFPQAEVIGLDLSPYMLVMAKHKAETTDLRFDSAHRKQINWYHGKAEATGFPNESFDLVTASLLFHETPPAVSKAILQEAFRLSTAGGQTLILEGNQKTLRQTQWLMDIFEEPYIKAYAAGNLDAWMGAAGFDRVETQEVWWTYQVTSGVKPLAVDSSTPQQLMSEENLDLQGVAVPA